MKALLFAIIINGLLSLAATAQNAPVLQWEKQYVNRLRPEDTYSINADKANRIIVAGTTYTPQPGGGSAVQPC